MFGFGKIPKHLPESTGPYVPGVVDVMLNYDHEEPFFRLYYPTNVPRKDIEKNSKKWISWILDDNYLIGFSKVLLLYTFVMRVVFWWAGSAKIPALYGEKPRTEEKLKCIVMSHGLGGNRSLYSNICCELASKGFLIAALEHRDQSACYTYYYNSKNDALRDNKTPIEFRHIKLGKSHYSERNSQLKQRAKECSKVLDFLLNLQKGIVPCNVMKDVPNELENNFKLEDLVAKLDVENITMMGHSFGAATALYTLSLREELRQGILLDPWMFPVKDEALDTKINQPLLFINTQTFHIASNVDAMSKMLTDDSRQMYTILHTTHENQTDTVLLIGYWLNWFMKKLDPLIALKINNALIMTFLNKRLGFPRDVKDCQQYLIKEKGNIEHGLTRPWA